MTESAPLATVETGLKRRVLANVEVFGQSIAGIGPVLDIVAVSPLIVLFAGYGAWITVLITTIAVLSIGTCLVLVAREHVSSGGMYNLVPQGLGPAAGLITGLTMLLAVTVAGAFLLFGIGLAIASFFAAVNIAVLSSGTIFVIELIVLAIVAMVSLRSITLSTNLMLALEAISALIILAIFILILVRHSGGIIDSRQLTLKGASLHGVIIGGVFLILDFGGFESSASLGLEARKPRRAVPLAVLGSVAVVGLFLMVGTYIQVLGFKGLHMSLVKQTAPLAVLAAHFGAGWLGNIITVGVIISFFSCSTAWLNYGSRLVFTMSSDGVLPRRFKSVLQRSGAPRNAIVALIIIYLGIITYVYVAGVSISNAFADTGTLLGYTYSFFYGNCSPCMGLAA